MKFLSAQLKGQTLVIILLGTSVALTVALAVSVRTISTLKQTTTSSQAQQALAAAEAGAEVALGYLKDGTCTQANLAACNISTPIVLSGSSTQYSVLTTATGSSTDPYLMDLAKDNTQEVKIGPSTVSSANICWWDPNLDGTETTNALEVIYVNDSGVMTKYAYNGVGPSPANGFTSTPIGPTQVTIPSNGKKINFNRCQNNVSVGYSDPTKTRILRLKAFYSSFSATVVPNNSLPAQGFQITSTGQTSDGSVKKAVRVTKSLPSLPGIFDFAIYSGSSSQPLSK